MYRSYNKEGAMSGWYWASVGLLLLTAVVCAFDLRGESQVLGTVSWLLGSLGLGSLAYALSLTPRAPIAGHTLTWWVTAATIVAGLWTVIRLIGHMTGRRTGRKSA